LPGGKKILFYKDAQRFDAWVVIMDPDGSTRTEKPGDSDYENAVLLGKSRDFEYVGFMDATEIANWNVAIWWTWWVVPALKRFLATAEGAGWNQTKLRTGVGAILVAFSVEPPLAATLATQIVAAYGGSGAYPKPTDLSLSDCPIYFKKMLDA
jgi:hypothetical protein